MHERAPRHAGVGAVARRVRHDDARRIGRVERVGRLDRDPRQALGLRRDRRRRPRRLARALVRGRRPRPSPSPPPRRRDRPSPATGGATAAGIASAGALAIFAESASHAGVRLPGLPRVAADDEQVLRARGGHVEQPIDLGVEIRLLRPARCASQPAGSASTRRAASSCLPPRSGSSPRAAAPSRTMRTSTRGSKPPSGSARNTTVGLEPLGLVQVHEPDDVATAGLERQRVDLGRFLRPVLVEPRPRGERVGGLRQREAALDDGADAIDGVEEIAGLDAAARRRREREIAGVLEDALERGAGRQHARPLEPLAQRRERRGDARGGRICRSSTSAKRLKYPPAWRNAKRSRSLRPKSGPRSTPTSATASCGSASAAEQQRELAHLLGLAERAGAGDLDRHLQRLERVGVRPQPLLLARENQEVAVRRAARRRPRARM